MTMKDPNDYDLHQTLWSKIHDCISKGSSTRARTAETFPTGVWLTFCLEPVLWQLNDKIPPVNVRPMTSSVKEIPHGRREKRDDLFKANK